MKVLAAYIGALALAVITATAASPQPQGAAGNLTDLYHVHFTKAAPGQAAALGKALMVPDPKSPMPDHFVVLRHQEGDDWDYAVIQHLGQKTTLDAAPAPPRPGRDLRAWHDDTFAIGPSWGVFSKNMGGGGGIYTVSVHRAVPGHREDLQKALSQPAPASSKVQTGNVLLQHAEGGDWTFLTVTRYNSWQDFAADRAAASPPDAGGWNDIRQHVSFHRDTIADRIFPR